MRFEEKLKKQKRDQLWSEYCGFLDMSLTEYMYVQRRLMEEQLELWRNSGLGKSLLKGQVPYTIDELRRMLPLTSYEDYADVLLSRRTEMLCAEPAIWIQTTWEGGLRPIKLAPYTRSMLDTYRHNLLAAMMMASARKKGDFDVKSGDRILYGGAPLPYMTGLMPSLFAEDIHFEFLPDSNKNSELSFSQRIKKGFSMALSGGVDVFFGIGSVANYITESFGKSGGGGGKTRVSPGNALRYARAKYISKRDGRAVVPGDIFRLKAFFYAGTDAKCYKERLTRAWGVVPTELAAGTESTCLGSEDWEHRGMVFFPDACFYEFIPEMEMRRNLRDPAYQPRTCLMDEVQAGEVYEIVLSVFHGGAFMRYRIGDMYRCLSAGGGQLPRMTFVDRVPNVIDIAGFTRITASSMEEVIRLSRLELGDWILKKEFNRSGDPFLHMYLEIPPEAQRGEVMTKAVLTEHLSLYFKYFDSDYGDLKKLLNMEPLEITLLKHGSIAAYEQRLGEKIPRINPDMMDVTGLLRQQTETEGGARLVITNIPFLYVNIIALSCFTLMFVTFLAAKKSPEIWAFQAVLLDCILWSGGSVLMRLQMWPGLNFWYTVSLVALFSLELLFYVFVHTFSRQKGKFVLTIFAVWTLLIWPGTISGRYLPAPTPVTRADGSIVFTYNETSWQLIIPCVMFVAIIAACAHLLIKVMRRQGIHSPGIQVTVSGGLVLLAGNLLQVCLPGNTFPFDMLSGIIFAVLLMVALYRRRMFRMTLVVSRTVLTVVLAMICLVTAANLIGPLQGFVEGQLGLSRNVATTVAAVLFAGVLSLSYTLVRRLLDAIFTREKEQNKLIKKFSSEVSQTLSTADIMEKLSDVICHEIPLERVYVCLREENGYQARYCSNPLATLSFSISRNSPQIACLGGQESYLILSEFQNTPQYLSLWESEKDLFRRLNIDCVAAMREGEEIVALVLLCAKDRSHRFNAAELDFLEMVNTLASIAMKNAALYEKMFREARIDPLTGMYNYRYFVEQLNQQFAECGKDCLTLLYIDVDDFKLYNQLYGVGEGDAALCRIGEAVNRCLGESGEVFRTSGKVFAVLLPYQDTQRGRKLATEIQERVRSINLAPERRRFKPLSVSIGICSAPYAAVSAKELMDNADLAVYNAKQGGKDQVMIFRGASNLVPKHLAERTDAIVDRVERGDGEYRSALSMISALTAAIDAKDHYTYAHSKNVARYAATLAVAVGLNDDQVRTIYAAALLHDIGKIAIPEKILNKTGQLDENEYQQMKDHVNNSIEMIRHLPEMDYLIPAVLGHHERWDGKGYPRGIAGEEIPVSARCLAIADVFDAMTTDRPYRKGLPLEYALEEILRQAGTQLDPELAPEFVNLIRNRSIPLSAQAAKNQN